jgi:hypothetical protein
MYSCEYTCEVQLHVSVHWGTVFFLNLTMLYVFLKSEKNFKTFLEKVFFFILERFHLCLSSAFKKIEKSKIYADFKNADIS